MIMQSRISSNTNLTAFSREGKRRMDQLIPIYAEAGYKDLDLNFCEMMNPDSPLLSDAADEYVGSLARLKEEYGLNYIQAHAPYPRDYAALPDEGKLKSDKAILRSMEFAARLGIPHIVVHPIAGTADANIRYFASLLERQKEPIVIAIENMETGSGICAAEDLMEIADALHPCAGICLDTGHAHIAGEDIPAFINRTGSLLIGTHIADNNGKEDQHLLPGFGTIRWEDVMKAFRTSGYRGFLNFECMFFSRNMPQLLSSEIARLSLMIGDWLLSL